MALCKLLRDEEKRFGMTLMEWGVDDGAVDVLFSVVTFLFVHDQL